MNDDTPRRARALTAHERATLSSVEDVQRALSKPVEPAPPSAETIAAMRAAPDVLARSEIWLSDAANAGSNVNEMLASMVSFLLGSWRTRTPRSVFWMMIDRGFNTMAFGATVPMRRDHFARIRVAFGSHIVGQADDRARVTIGN